MQAEGILLNNSVVMPLLGFGTWKIAEGAPIIEATNFALEAGYRLFDTAKLYENEKGLGNALLSSGFDRDEYFVTSKVWNSDQGYEATLKAFDVSLKNTGLDYLDAYLIHWPMPRTKSNSPPCTDWTTLCLYSTANGYTGWCSWILARQ